MCTDFNVFRQGDIRGHFPRDINEDFAYQLGLSFAHYFQPVGPIVTGHDQRASSPLLHDALNLGLIDGGIDVLDIGLCPTELIYFSATLPDIDGAIMVTASHNPAIYNGFKPVLKNAKPITHKSGLLQLKNSIAAGKLKKKHKMGLIKPINIIDRYLDFLCQHFIGLSSMNINLAVNGMNGCASVIADPLFKRLGIETDWLYGEPSTDFPKKGPDPIRTEYLENMKRFMQKKDYSLGLAWDGDGDRCLFFGSNGEHYNTYYIIGLLIQAALNKHPGAKIVFDPIAHWNTIEIIKQYGGIPIRSMTGHALVKQKMSDVDAAYGGERSAHHYFRELKYCDSGMFPWLTLLEYLQLTELDIDEYIKERKERFQVLPEVNIQLCDMQRALTILASEYRDKAIHFDNFDGHSYEFKEGWRFNIRASNTEPLARINLESKNGLSLIQEKFDELTRLLQPYMPE